jgi:hypothetical protein
MKNLKLYLFIFLLISTLSYAKSGTATLSISHTGLSADTFTCNYSAHSGCSGASGSGGGAAAPDSTSDKIKIVVSGLQSGQTWKVIYDAKSPSGTPDVSNSDGHPTKSGTGNGTFYSNNFDPDGDYTDYAVVIGNPPNNNPVATGSTKTVTSSTGTYTSSSCISVSDADGDSISYDPTSFSYAATSNTAAKGLTQIASQSITVSDGYSGSASATCYLQYSYPDDNPTWSTTPINQTLSGSGDLSYNWKSGASDPDSADSITYSYVSGAPQGDPANAYNYSSSDEGTYTVTVRATGSPTYVDKTFTLTISNANDTPSIGLNSSNPTASVDVLENTTAVTSINATDDDGDVISYSLSGADASEFTIDSSGNLSFVNPKDFENPSSSAGTNSYEVIVTISDPSNETDTQTITVNVTNDIYNDLTELNHSKSNWVTILKGAKFDPTDDLQAQAAIDILGNVNDPLFFMSFEENDNSTTVDDVMKLRIRTGRNTLDKKDRLDGYIWMGIDVDLDGDIDTFLMLIGKLGSYKLYVYEAGKGTNDSPSTTSITKGVLLDILDNDEIHFDTVKNIDGSSYSNIGDNAPNDDMYISFQFNYDDFRAIANSKPLTGTKDSISSIDSGAGLTKDTKIRYIIATAMQENSLNGDIGGYGAGDDYSLKYLDQGIFSAVMTGSNPIDIDDLDTQAPTIVDTNPKDDSTSVKVDQNLTMTFNENITIGSGNIVIKNSSGTIIETIDVTSNQVTVSDTVVNIDLINNLNFSTSYYVQIDAGTFVDSSSNSYTGISDTTSWNFTTLANQSPVVQSNSFAISENIDIGTILGTILATDLENDTLSYSITSGDTNNDFVIDTNTGELSVAKSLNAYLVENYSLEITATDSVGNSGSEIVTISVTNEIDTPIATNDTSITNEDTNITINIISNDSDADGNINNGSVQITQYPQNGIISIDSSGVANYIPNQNYYGNDTFKYKIYDMTSLVSNEATVTVTINPVNDTPIAYSGTVDTREDENLTINLTSFVSDPDGIEDIASYSIVSNPTNGTINLVDNEVFYVPNVNFYGTDNFTFYATDTDGLITETKKIVINVAEVNDIPIARFDNAIVNEDNSINIDILANDSDDGTLDISTIVIEDKPSYGNVTVELNGTVTYTPNANWYGNDSFSYTVKDDGLVTNGLGSVGVLTSEITNVMIDVISVNDTPIAVDDNFTMNEDSQLLMNLHVNDTDIDNDLNGSSITISTNPSHGTIIKTTLGQIKYIPIKDFNGTDSFDYKIIDGLIDSNIASVNIAVNNINDNPSFQTPKDHNITENNNSIIVKIIAQDVDDANSSLNYNIVNSKDSEFFDFNTTTNELKFILPKDYENPQDSNGDNIYNIDINVTDSSDGYQIRTFNIEVINVDEPPVLDTILNLDILEDTDDFNITLVANDEDNDTIIFNANSSNTSIADVFVVDNKLEIRPQNNQSGTITVEVNATANSVIDTKTFTIIINAVNDAPQITSTEITNVVENNPYTYTVTATDVENDPIDFNISVLPYWLDFNTTTHVSPSL